MESNRIVDELTSVVAGMTVEAGSVYEALARIKDGRGRQGRQYSLALILTMLVLGKLAGEKTVSGIAQWARLRSRWLCEALGVPIKRLPCANTYSYASAKVDLAEVNAVLAEVLGTKQATEPAKEQPAKRGGRHLALDGKTVRRSGVHLLGLYDVKAGLVLDQRAVTAGNDERQVAVALVSERDLQGVLVSADALHTQRTWCQQIRERGGDYLLFAKANQPTLYADITLLFQAPLPVWMEHRSATTVNKGHGRRERRSLQASTELADYLSPHWPDVAQVFCLERRVTRHQRTTHELVYGFTSLPHTCAGPRRLLSLVRAHWRIENRLHWRRDVTLREDHCRSHPHVAQLLATLNNTVLALMDRLRVPNVPAKMREFNADPHAALLLLTRSLPFL